MEDFLIKISQNVSSLEGEIFYIIFWHKLQSILDGNVLIVAFFAMPFNMQVYQLFWDLIQSKCPFITGHFFLHSQEQDKADLLEHKKRDLEREVDKIKGELGDTKLDLEKAATAKRDLKSEVKAISERVYSMEAMLEEERRKQNRYVANMAGLEEQVSHRTINYFAYFMAYGGYSCMRLHHNIQIFISLQVEDEKQRNQLAAKRIAQLTEDYRNENLLREKAELTQRQLQVRYPPYTYT